MENLGAEVVSVEDGQRTLKDAINEAMRDWATNMADTHYVLGTACGAHPFPEMVSWFQSIIGLEAREQILASAGRLPDRVYACVGGGSNAVGIFQGFLDDEGVELIGCEAGGFGTGRGQHASRLAYHDASVGVAQGFKTYFLQDEQGNMLETHSVAAGLDYIGVNPILVWLWERGKVRFEAATDAEVADTLRLVMRTEGLIPAWAKPFWAPSRPSAPTSSAPTGSRSGHRRSTAATCCGGSAIGSPLVRPWRRSRTWPTPSSNDPKPPGSSPAGKDSSAPT